MSLDLDMKEIFDIFSEECSEGLDVMESGLLGLDQSTSNLDVVNDIFRAAHSIKGGAATFGFLEIAEFTHGVETLLDELREGTRPVSDEIVESLLASVDCLRGMLGTLTTGVAIDSAQAKLVQGRIERILQTDSKKDSFVAPTTCATERWQIEFEPDSGILKRGDDPIKIFNELRSLGTLEVISHFDLLPELDDLDPEKCFLHWTLTLETAAEKNAIEEAFVWVADNSSIKIEKMPSISSEDTTSQNATSTNSNSTKKTNSIRVAVDKVDTLLNLVGELVITQSMLKRCGEEYSPERVADLQDGLMELERYTRELQESAMQIRMLPISVSFSRFPRLVRDLTAKMGKQVALTFTGEHTELDKNVLEKMSDPLVHLVRNSLDHGIESPAERVAAGKPETGTLHLSASHENGSIVIRVQDDGAGINRERVLNVAIKRNVIAKGEQLSDEQIDNLIFRPGFSTAEEVTEVSGRGVGMDVVRNNIKDLGGRLEVSSTPGRGSTFTIRLPLTLAILDGQLVRAGGQVYVFSLLSILETVQVPRREVGNILGGGKVFRIRDNYIPVARLSDLLNTTEQDGEAESELLVIVESDGCTIGLFVDELLEQQQVVIKSLEENYRIVDGISGATILGDGRVSLIIDVPGLMQQIVNFTDPHLARGHVAA